MKATLQFILGLALAYLATGCRTQTQRDVTGCATLDSRIVGYWYEIAPNPPEGSTNACIRELVIVDNGKFYLSWTLVESYYHYWGRVQTDSQRNEIAFMVLGGNYIPPWYRGGPGSYHFGSTNVDLLYVKDVRFGSPEGKTVDEDAIRTNGYVFERLPEREADRPKIPILDDSPLMGKYREMRRYFRTMDPERPVVLDKDAADSWEKSLESAEGWDENTKRGLAIVIILEKQRSELLGSAIEAAKWGGQKRLFMKNYVSGKLFITDFPKEFENKDTLAAFIKDRKALLSRDIYHLKRSIYVLGNVPPIIHPKYSEE